MSDGIDRLRAEIAAQQAHEQARAAAERQREAEYNRQLSEATKVLTDAMQTFVRAMATIPAEKRNTDYSTVGQQGWSIVGRRQIPGDSGWEGEGEPRGPFLEVYPDETGVAGVDGRPMERGTLSEAIRSYLRNFHTEGLTKGVDAAISVAAAALRRHEITL
jgi:hypothetical protein